MLPYTVDYVPYTASHLVTQLQLLLFSGLAFFALLPLMKRTLTISLDFDWVYRRLILSLINRLISLLSSQYSFAKRFEPGVFHHLVLYRQTSWSRRDAGAHLANRQCRDQVVVLLTVFLLFSIY